MEPASEKGASNWLTTQEFGFGLLKGAFADSLALHYWSTPTRILISCVCGSHFTVEHVLSCPRGGFPILCHNEIQDMTVNLLTEVCHDVRTEPDLTGEAFDSQSALTSDSARLDIAVNGFFIQTNLRFNVWIFNPHAQSNRNATISSCYRKHKKACL